MDVDPHKLYQLSALYFKKSSLNEDTSLFGVQYKTAVLYRQEPLAEDDFTKLLQKVVRAHGNDLSDVVKALIKEHGFEKVPLRSFGMKVTRNISTEAPPDRSKMN